MKKFLTFATAAFVAVATYAYSVTVRIAGGDGDAEPFATCRVFAAADTVHAVAVGVADSSGVYTAPLPSAGTYALHAATATGNGTATAVFTVSDDAPDANAGTLVPTFETQNLRELTVTAQRPLVSKMIDRIGYDVQADPDVRTINLQDMMRRVPLVAVDGEGNITINGSSNFKVFKDGRPNNAFTKNAKDIFKAIPASMIKRVEVITEPGAKYDAEGIGAILNIVTMEGTRVDGVTGTISLNGDTHQRTLSPNGYVTTQIDKVTLSFNGGYHHSSPHNNNLTMSNHYTYNNGSASRRSSYQSNKGDVVWFGTEGSYDINKHHLITLEADGYWYRFKTCAEDDYLMTGADGTVLNAYRSLQPYSPMSYFTADGAVNYQYTTGRPGETVTAGYLISNTNQTDKKDVTFSDIAGNMLQYTAQHTDTRMNFQEHTFQTDWVRPFASMKHTLETGAKYTLRLSRSRVDNEYVGLDNQYTDFRHITDIGAVYGQYTGRFGKFTLRGGLRYEFSRLKAEFPDGSQKDFHSTLNDLVPSASLSWQVNDAHSLAANYAMRINRPGISYLNPAVYQGANSISYGNPDLESAHANSLKITYTLIKKAITINASAGYGWNNDNITSVNFVDDRGYVVNTYDNIGSMRELRLSTFLQWTIGPKTTFMANLNANRNSYRQNGMRLARWGGYGFMRISQNLPWDLTLEGMFSPQIPGLYNVYSYTKTGTPYFYGLGINRSFLKEKRLSVRLSAYNFFSGKYNDNTTHTVNGDYLGTNTTNYNAFRGFQLGVSYRFGNLNARVKKTARAAEKESVEGGIGK